MTTTHAMPPHSIKKIVIVGGGTAGWMAAAMLSRALGKLATIQLIESDAIGTVGVGEATIPQIKLFNEVLGFEENDFLRQTQGTFKLGIQFNNWGKIGDSYMHAFGGLGIDLGMLDFYQYWLKARLSGSTSSLWDYSLNAAASRANHFAPMERVGETRLPGIKYAYHFDASLFALYLRNYCNSRGAQRIEGKIIQVHLHSGNGFIESVELENGTRIAGDLFLDCSGFNGLLIEGALSTGYENWNHWLPCDKAAVVASEASTPLIPYTKATAQTAGWQWRIPLQQRTGNGHVFCSQHMSDDEACHILLQNLDAPALAEPRLLNFVTGKRKKFWNKNCVALGLSGGFMEPLESTSIHLVQVALGKLIDLFPYGDCNVKDAEEFNRQLDTEYEQIRDFLILHYHLNSRTDSSFWKDCRAMPVPETVTRKQNLFASNGRIFRENNELFAELAWLQVMLGQGIMPAAAHPLTYGLSDKQLDEYLTNVRTIVGKAVAVLPKHEDYIKRFCAV